MPEGYIQYSHLYLNGLFDLEHHNFVNICDDPDCHLENDVYSCGRAVDICAS